MKTILVLAGGGRTDKEVFDAALAVARPLGANLEFLHVRLEAVEAAIHTPHVDYATGRALHAALVSLDVRAQERATAALHHFEELCERERIGVASRPSELSCAGMSACWCEEHENAEAKIVRCARHNDLVVVGRRSGSNGLPVDLLEQVLLRSGRPVLIAPDEPGRRRTGTALVCWKETAESARAVGAALPILAASRRVVIASVEEAGGQSSAQDLQHLAQRLAWNGIAADPRWLGDSAQPAADRLRSLATEIDADLLVMGGYGHGRLREVFLGGCTQQFLDRCDRPVLLMH
jgi:nucleotide-binding universal stress UspA family protein